MLPSRVASLFPGFDPSTAAIGGFPEYFLVATCSSTSFNLLLLHLFPLPHPLPLSTSTSTYTTYSYSTCTCVTSLPQEQVTSLGEATKGWTEEKVGSLLSNKQTNSRCSSCRTKLGIMWFPD